MFIVTRCVGAVGKIIFAYGNLLAKCSATSANPSDVSPKPWHIIMVADWDASFEGVRVMVPSPERVVVWKDAIVGP